jgi:hypothetical protein
MTPQAQYEYRFTYIDDENLVDEQMKTWADAGWELVSGSAASNGNGLTKGHVRYVTYWRKPIAKSTN